MNTDELSIRLRSADEAVSQKTINHASFSREVRPLSQGADRSCRVVLLIGELEVITLAEELQMASSGSVITFFRSSGLDCEECTLLGVDSVFVARFQEGEDIILDYSFRRIDNTDFGSMKDLTLQIEKECGELRATNASRKCVVILEGNVCVSRNIWERRCFAARPESEMDLLRNCIGEETLFRSISFIRTSSCEETYTQYFLIVQGELELQMKNCTSSDVRSNRFTVSQYSRQYGDFLERTWRPRSQ